MKNLVWRLRNTLAKISYIRETFGSRALAATLWRKLKETAKTSPALPTSPNESIRLFPLPRAPAKVSTGRVTFIIDKLDTDLPEAELGAVIKMCTDTGRALRIVTRSCPARTDIFGAFVKARHPAFRANVDFSFVDSANPYAELPVEDDDLFWPGAAARKAVPEKLILDKAAHVSL